MERLQGIYKIKNLVNNKVYIGQSQDIENRFSYHKCGSNYNIKHPLYNSIKKYGLNHFEFSVIELVNDILKLDEREQYWMDYYKSYDRNCGYNLRPKAESNKGIEFSEEHREKLRQAAIERWKDEGFKEDVTTKLRGQKRSKESKQLMSKKAKEREISEGFKQNMFVKGQKSWNKGKKHNEESKRKMSEVKKGRIPWNKGKKMNRQSEEIQKKRSDSLKEFYRNKKFVIKNDIILLKEVV